MGAKAFLLVHRLNQIYSKLRILSVDVVIGTLMMTYLFACLLNSRMSVTEYFIVGSGVWLTYTLDHLLDAKRIGERANTQRHVFHYTHYSVLLNLWYVVFLSVFITSLIILPTSLLIGGLGITVLVLVHFIFIKIFGQKVTIYLQKEVLIALIYTAGVSFIPIIKATVELNFETYVVLIEVFFIALINLIEFSFFEYQTDIKDRSGSLVRFLGINTTKVLLGILIASVFCIITYATFTYNSNQFLLIQSLIGLMTITLSVILLKPSYFRSAERYRIFGDLVFMFPLVLYIAK